MKPEGILRVIVLSPPLENSGGVGTLFKYAIPNFSACVNVSFIDTRGSRDNPLFSIINVIDATVRLSVARVFGRVDVIHLNLGARGSTLRKLILLLYSHFILRLPNVVQLHSSSFDIFFDNSSKYVKKIIVKTLCNADQILVLGMKWKEYLISIGLPYDKVREFQMGVPDLADKEFTGSETHRELFLPFPTLLYAGAMGERKGLPNLLRAIAQIKQFSPHLNVAGSGDLLFWKDEAKNLNVEDLVEFHGLLPPKSVLSLLINSDILILPSNAEGLPVSVLEALSAAKLVLCTKVGSLAQFLSNNLNCYFLETPAVGSIVEQLNVILKNQRRDELKNIMQEARLVWKEHFNVEITTNILENIWNQCAGRKMG